MKNIYKSLNETIDYLEEDIFEEPDMKTVCRLLELNSNVASSLFELLTGYTIKDYVRKRRLSEAAIMLTKERVIDVAMTCGYDSREGFSRAFKAFHGFSPSKCPHEFNYLEKIHFDEKLLIHPVKQMEFVSLPSATLFGISSSCSNNELEKEKNELWSKIDKNSLTDEVFLITKLRGGRAFLTLASKEKLSTDAKEFQFNGGKFILSNSSLSFSPSSHSQTTIELSKNGTVKYLYLY